MGGGKPKREREKDKETLPSATTANDALTPASPQIRQKQVHPVPSTATPTILQREGQGVQNPAGIITKPLEVSTQAPREDGAGAGAAAGGAGRGHRGRGRGRGGRGGRGG